MLRLLQPGNLRRIVREPERVAVRELVEICHQIFWVQFVLGIAGFVPAAYNHALGLETVLNVVAPVAGILHTREVDPESYRAVRLVAVYWAAGVVVGLVSCLVRAEWQALPKVLLKTLVSSVQWLAIGRLWRMLMDERMTRSSFFLNVVVLNKKEVVKTQAQSRTGWGEKVGTRSLGRLTGALANRVVSDEKFSVTLGTKMCINIPTKMALNGIQAHAELQFTRGNLFVLLVTVDGIDVQKLVAKKAGAEKAERISRWLSFLPKRLRDELTDLMLSQIGAELMRQMPENVANEMREVGGVDVAVETKSREEEAEYLFALLAQLDRSEEAEEARRA